MSSWRRSKPIALTIIVVFLTIQMAIPISRLGDHQRSMRFGWQMFSVVNVATEFTVHTAAGSDTIDLGDFLGRVRGDLDLEALVPPHICQTVEGAQSVTWHDEEYTCSSD